VVRGADLLGSTARQIQLFEALQEGGGVAERGAVPKGETRVPDWGHVPLVRNSAGEKLSKRDEALTLRALRAAGMRPEALVGWMGASLGLLDRPEPCRAEELVPRFSWDRLHREDHVLPPDFLQRLTGSPARP